MWTNSFQRSEEQRVGLLGRGAGRSGSSCAAVFESHPLVVKGADFQAFAAIVRSMRKKEHLTKSGFERLVRLAYGMNANGKQRARSIEEVLAGSSETVCEASQLFSPSRVSERLR